jgi:hypothetical protein
MNCTRCKKGIGVKCDTCPDYLCEKCILIHNKFNECFIEKQVNKYYWCDKEGSYDFGMKRFYCVNHW